MKSKYLASTACALLFAATSLSNVANAGLMTLTFDNTSSLSDWTKDRTTPSGFEIINDELVMTVAGELDDDNFYNTQGMQLDIGESNYMSVDMWIDSSWTATGRFGGLWAVAYNADTTRADEYPILEFQNDPNGATGVAKWESGIGWVVPPSSQFTMDAFNKLEIMLVNNTYQYLVNGNLVHTAASTSTYLGSIILNGYNTMSADGGYQVRYDNVTYGTVNVPEPSTLAIFALALAGLGARRFSK
ncbi:PEP-CTERM sorting domain-containing protein [Thalassotalea profundi]|uniref:Ice-binding protein C-terminal domain-containing protein n=1 Tax=Thalassotalea profundi TaxID=2036687 RepID=A0ABQ3IGY4_9GAMM|nr:PEP-CTERM sorting domain-containing protein [Thalassotalea profundi]GHE84193.1 hypothetical protein GCM10011501_10920 [Thalassotalea profundi]